MITYRVFYIIIYPYYFLKKNFGGKPPNPTIFYFFIHTRFLETPSDTFVKVSAPSKRVAQKGGKMAKKETSFSMEKKVRIYDLKVAQDMKRVLDLNHPRYNSYNSIMVEAMKFGLPKILEEVEPATTIDDIITRESNRLILHSNRLFEKLSLSLNKILISAVFTQELSSVILNELELILVHNNIEMTESMRSELMQKLPEPLDQELNNLLSKIQKNDKN